MNTFAKLYLNYRYPRYKKAFSLAFNPDGYHHYPNELKSNVKNLNPELLTEGLLKSLQRYAIGGNESDNLLALKAIGHCIAALPVILESIIEMINHSNLSFSNKKHLLSIIIYLISPVDIIPEEDMSGVGYADDIIFSSIALNEINPPNQRQLVKDNWQGNNDNLEKLLSVAPFAKEGIPHLYNMANKAFQGIFV